MNRIFEHELYREDIASIAALPLPWERLEGKSILISGASGLIGSCLIDVLRRKNEEGLRCTVYALARDEKRARARFAGSSEDIRFVQADINQPLARDDIGTMHFVLHLASNTHPRAYATDPVGTIITNILGTRNMLEFAAAHGAERCAFASSNEIYGENRGDTELFQEDYCGYIDSNTLRAGYPESKRCGEALCQAYIRQAGLDIVIPRFTRAYGPTMRMEDSKAISQFLKNGIAGEPITLKSAGTQYYSFIYVSDAVSGLLTTLLRGETGEAYNIANRESDITLRALAELIAEISGTSVTFADPDALESAGFSKATKARLDSAKLQRLGWRPAFPIRRGLEHTLTILKDLRD